MRSARYLTELSAYTAMDAAAGVERAVTRARNGAQGRRTGGRGGKGAEATGRWLCVFEGTVFGEPPFGAGSKDVGGGGGGGVEAGVAQVTRTDRAGGGGGIST